jgi:HSP20 family protein
MYWQNFNDVDPWRMMTRMQRDMNRLFNNVSLQDRGVYPAVNLWSNNDKALLIAELPGYEPENIHISVRNDELILSGKRDPIQLKENEQYHRQERLFGQFERRISLPFRVEENKIEANYEQGVLCISLPRADADKPKKITIKSK